eukprot:4663228-Pleurochrysis_carterae.AAC.1
MHTLLVQQAEHIKNSLQPASGKMNVIACTIDLNCLQPTKYAHVKVDNMHGVKLFNATGGRTVYLV